MKQHNLKQGSPEWLAHRRNFHNASDAAAMMGVSPYKTRDQLLQERFTGLTADVGDQQQRRFDTGHRSEALARPLAEEFIGEELFPVVGTEGNLSASFDGLTMAGRISYEHKSLNDELRACFKDMETINPEHRETASGKSLPIYHRIQMEHQHLVSKAEKTLFMASKWAGEDLIEEQHCWYFPNAELAADIVAGWAQFDIDLTNYVPPEASKPAATATPRLALPAVSITVEGEIALIDNLAVFEKELDSFIAGINLKPETDQDFADLDGAAKTLKAAEEALEAGKATALGRVTSMDMMVRNVDRLKAVAAKYRLLTSKLYESEKLARKALLVLTGKDAAAAHINELNASLGKPYMPLIAYDFADVIKGMKSVDNMKSAINTELARVKIEANAVAEKIRTNIKTLQDMASEHKFLFADTAQLVLKANEDLIATITARISEHDKAEAKRLEKQREDIRAEEKTKAEAEARTTFLAQQEAQRLADLAAKPVPEPAQAQVAVPAIDPAMAQVREVVRAATPPAVAAPAVRPPIKADTPPTLKLGEINARLQCMTVTAANLASLGFEPAGRDKNAILFHEHQYPEICAALIQRLHEVRELQTA